MRLVAAVVPPAGVLEEALARVQSVRPAGTAGSGADAGRRDRPRRGRRRDLADEPAEMPEGPAFAPAAAPYLLVAKFGNVSLTDIDRLEARTSAVLAELPAPLLRIEGVDLEASSESGAVHVTVGGDTDALRDVVRGVQDAAARTQLFVDRRVFRPDLEIGTFTGSASEKYAALVLETLQGFVGDWWWQSHVSLMTPGNDAHHVHVQSALKPRSGPI